MRQTDPLWVDPGAQSYPCVSTDIKADVAIVGAGISGIAAAWWLKASGVRDVVVVDRRTVAGGATGRNAGFVMAVSSDQFAVTSDGKADGALARLWEFTRVNQQLIEDTIQACDLDCDYRKRGGLALAASPAEWGNTKSSAAKALASGLAVELWQREDLPLPYLQEHYYGGAWYPANAEMHPGKFTCSLARHLAIRGVRVYERSPVSAIVPKGSSISLRVGNYSIEAAQIVLATNAYTSSLQPDLHHLIAPVRGQVMVTQPLDQLTIECPVYAHDGYEYWRQLPDGRLLVGGWRNLDPDSEVGTDENLNPTIQQALDVFASGVTSGAAAPAYRWAGIMGFTPDALPLIGRLPRSDRIVLAAGYTGHGLAMGFHGARLAIEVLLEGTGGAADLFDPVRFAGSPERE